jgi:6-phosphogluconolactonase
MNSGKYETCLRKFSVGGGGHSRLAVLLALIGAGNYLSGQLVYVPNYVGQSVSAFVVNADAGSLTEVLPRATTPGSPTAVVVEPGGKFAYVVNVQAKPNITTYRINAGTGALEQLADKVYPPIPIGVCVDPAGKYLYSLSQDMNNISAFTINTSTGALTWAPGGPVATGTRPSGVIVDRTGKFVYVTNQGSNDVSVYKINANNGALGPIPGSPFASGAGPSRVTVDATGNYLYVTNQKSNNVSAYKIDTSTGVLAPVPGSPFAAGAGPTAAAVDPTGKFLYVPNGDDNTVSVYMIDAGTGALAPVPGSPVSAQRGPFGVVIDPAGKYLYVTNLLSNSVSAYTINSAGGALSPVPGSPFTTGNQPQRPAIVQLSPAVLPPVVVQSALNAASYALPGLPNYGIARGSMFIIFGQNIGPAGLQQAKTFPLQTQLGGTSVKVTVGGVTNSAIMVYTYLSQVAAILPSSTPAGDGTLTVTYEGRTSAAISIHVVDGSPAVFTRNQAGSGPAIVQNYNSASNQPVNEVTEAAHPGQTMILWGTGLGAVSFDETQPPQVQNVRNDVEVWVGNKRARVDYSGRSPQFPGIDQINFTLPADVPQGCYVPLVVKAGKVASNFATLAITTEGKVCSDAHGLSSKDWTALQTGGALNVGWIQLLRMNVSANIPGLGSGTGLADSGWSSIFRWNTVTGAADQGLDMLTGRGTSFGGCSIYTFRGSGASLVPLRANFLKAGPALNITGPSGSAQLRRNELGYYEARKTLGALVPPGISDRPLPPPFWEPGTIRVDNGSGDADVGSFNASLTIAASSTSLKWTNRDAISASGIDRSADLTFSWTGGDPASEYVVIAGAVILPGLMSDQMQVAASFTCTEKVSAGQFTVPSVVLSALPASTPDDPMSGMVIVGRAPLLSDNLKFTGKGLDLGYLTYAVFDGTIAAYR